MTPAWHGLHVVIPHPNQDSVDALVPATNKQLSHDHDVLGVHGTVGDPVLLGEGVRRVDDELLGVGVVRGSGLHLHGVVAIAKLCQSKTTNIIEIVDTVQKNFVVSLCAQFEDSSSKQVELDSHLGRHGGVNNGRQFMSSKDPEWIVPEVKN